MERKSLKLDKSNPCPFAQPFLCIAFSDKQLNGLSGQWYVDVNGAISLYINNSEWHMCQGHHNCIADATDLMKSIIESFKKNRRDIVYIDIYKGIPTAFPTHILRNGELFRRVSINDPAEIISITSL